MLQDFRRHETQLIVQTAYEIQSVADCHMHHIQQFNLTEKAARQLTQEMEEEEYTNFQDAVADIKTKVYMN